MNQALKLTTAATVSIPRRAMIIITLIYALAGLFGHDPWKNDDAEGFGVMWTIAHGNWIDWILPHIAGRNELIGAPLPYWLGAASIQLLGPWIGEVNAARLLPGLCFILTAATIWYSTYLLGRRPEVQPMEFALGGQPTSREYGKTIADAALLIFLACVGLAIRVHEASPMVVSMWSISLLVYGIVRGFDKPLQGGAWTGLALGIMSLSGMLWTTVFLGLTTLLTFLVSETRIRGRWLVSLLVVLTLILSIWPVLWWISHLSSSQINQALYIWWGRESLQAHLSPQSLEFLGVNFWAYAWPVWPLCFWGIYLWGKNGLRGWNATHLVVPGLLLLAEFLLLLFMKDLSEHDLLLLIPPMVILAAFGLPFLKRRLINFIDWLSLFTFSITGVFIWVIWFAKITGHPQVTADNVSRYLPGFVARFNIFSFLLALFITVFWIYIVRWRITRAPRVIWRCLIISASGTTLMWVLLMTLWLPTIDYAKTYRPVAERFAKALPKDAICIDSTYLGDAQLASFAYFTGLPLHDNPQCNYLLTHSAEELKKSAQLNRQTLTLIWEDRRDSDRDERLRLYHATPEK